MEELRVKDLEKKFEKGFKISYSKIREAVLKCEIDKNRENCKKIFKDLNIEVYD